MLTFSLSRPPTSNISMALALIRRSVRSDVVLPAFFYRFGEIRDDIQEEA